MRITRPRIGFAIISAALAAMGTTCTMFAADAHAQGPTCYSTCPPQVDLEETFHVLHPGSEEIEDFSVRVGHDFFGGGSAPTGTVTVETTTGTVLCTIVLDAHGRGHCSPGANALPDGHYEVVAHYNGDASDSPATSRPRQLEINGGRGIGRGGFPFGGTSTLGDGFPLGGAFYNFLFFLEELLGGNTQVASATF